MEPIRLAIIGMGGFAADHHRAAHALEQEGECRVVCTCDPRPDDFKEAMNQLAFAARGVQMYPDHVRMLDAHRHSLDVVTVPTPIPLHASMHRAVVERGLACYLEKPPTLDYAELNEMLAVEAGAQKLTQVGFNFIIEAERQAMKLRVLSGEFGAVRRVGFLGMAPRPTTYFTRSDWAGRLMMNGRLVLDSVIGNAVAHYLHNLLFWAGQDGILSWNGVWSVRAEMYRAHAIENMDTLFALGECTNGIEVVIATTHACGGEHLNQEWIECDQAVIRHTTWGPYQIDWNDRRKEMIPTHSEELLRENLRYYFKYLRGDHSRPLTRLLDTRPFVESYGLSFVAARQITPVPGHQVSRSPAGPGRGEYVAIHDIRSACDAFIATRRFPSEQALAWGRPGGEARIEELDRLRTVVERMKLDVSGR